MSKTYYLCGPMSGRPQFNIPLFDEAARRLRESGLTIVSPAELDEYATRAACLASPDGITTAATSGSQTWAEFLSRDVKLIADTIDGLILLPEWCESRGARLEVFVGLLCKKDFGYYAPNARLGPGHVEWASPDWIRMELSEHMP